MSQCKHIKQDGAQCQQFAVEGDKHCFWHSSKVSEADKVIARSKGGMKSALAKNPLKKKNSRKIKNISKILDEVYGRVADGSMNTSTAKTIADIMNLQLKTLESVDQENKIQKILDKLDE
jgi:hypothetical protein